ncbi:MAG: SoxR reducing system RseC family protein [Gammaproteobacteria bacterium]
MLTENAEIVRVQGGKVWVRTSRQSTCGSCSVRQGCGTSVISKVVGNRQSEIEVLASGDYKPGEQVVIGIQESALVRGSLAVYLVPLLALFAGALMGNWLANAGSSTQTEAMSIFAGIAGFAGGMWWLKLFTRKIRSDDRYQPVVLSRTISTR